MQEKSDATEHAHPDHHQNAHPAALRNALRRERREGVGRFTGSSFGVAKGNVRRVVDTTTCGAGSGANIRESTDFVPLS